MLKEMLKTAKELLSTRHKVVMLYQNETTPYTPSLLSPAIKGTVTGADDIGTIHVNWDSGSYLGDSFQKMNARKQGGQNMNEKVKEQILIIRDSGVTNMFDVKRVQHEANRLGFYELVLYLEEHKDEYCRFILTGETP